MSKPKSFVTLHEYTPLVASKLAISRVLSYVEVAPSLSTCDILNTAPSTRSMPSSFLQVTTVAADPVEEQVRDNPRRLVVSPAVRLVEVSDISVIVGSTPVCSKMLEWLI